MTKRIIAVLLVVCMAAVLMAACGSKVVDIEEAKKIALKDMGITEQQATAVDAHITEHEGIASYSIYITYNGAQTEYIIHGKTGEILHKGPGSHSHSH
jgi:uncharacterized membrane protein YkoI